VFSDLEKLSHKPAIPQNIQAPDDLNIVVYTSASCKNKNESTEIAGGGAWYPDNSENNTSILASEGDHSQHSSELMAMIHVARHTEKSFQLTFRTKSDYIINSITKNLGRLEDSGWIGTINTKLLKILVAELHAQTNYSILQKIAHGKCKEELQAATDLANYAINDEWNAELDLDDPEIFVTTRAKISYMTQASLYKRILAKKKDIERRVASIMLERIRDGTKELTGVSPTDKTMWLSFRHKDFPPKIRSFLWKSTQGAYKVGKY
jgi:hypothetical protein